MYFQENGNKTVKSHVEKIDSKCQIIHTTISNKRKRTTIEKHDVEDDVKHNDENDTDSKDEEDSDEDDTDIDDEIDHDYEKKNNEEDKYSSSSSYEGEFETDKV